MPSQKSYKIDFAIGGQALIEGVMMRSPNFISIALRKPNKRIKYKNYPFRSLIKKIKWLDVVIIRGMINLVEMMVWGIKALNYSAAVYAEDQTAKLKEKPTPKKQNKSLRIIVGIIYGLFTLAFSLVLALFLFKFLPLWITTFFSQKIQIVSQKQIIFNLIDGVIKMSFFILYVFLISLIPDITRVFEYHGAEHKAVFTYEKGLPLTVKNAKPQSRFHPRCGTSFILVVVLISILIYTIVPQSDVFIVKFFQRLALLPLIAGISYEFLKWTARHQENKIVKFLVTPGLMFQKLTTREPDEQQLKIGLSALEKALKLEKNIGNKNR